jgi:predicted dehydrogenase
MLTERRAAICPSTSALTAVFSFQDRTDDSRVQFPLKTEYYGFACLGTRFADRTALAACHQLALNATIPAQAVEARKIKVAVLGTGSLGKEHVRIYADLAAARVVTFAGIYDLASESARKLAEKYQVRQFNSIQEAADASDALNIVTPTTTHYEIGKQLLEAGRHILVEKPMADKAAHASELVELAQKRNLVLQVGHVERFNPVLKYLERVATDPRFIETHRLSPYPARSTDIGVVLDLMIHDLDVVLAFVKSPLTSVDAVGIPVLSQSADIANARLRFANGCVANMTVSRVSPERMRKIRVFSGGPSTSYISLDYRAQAGFIYRIAQDGETESSLLKKLLASRHSSIVSEFGGKKIVREPVPITKEEPLKLELEHFVECVQARREPVVSGQSAKRALDLAFEITRQIETAALRPSS